MKSKILPKNRASWRMQKVCLIVMILIVLILISGCNNQQSQNEELNNTSNGIKFYNQEENIIEENLTELNNEIKEEANDSNLTVETNSTKEIVDFEKREEKNEECKLIMFHNGRGPMCLEQLEFLDGIKNEFSSLIITEYLTTNSDNLPLLYEMESEYGSSEGISDNFGNLPISFINDNAYSGFDNTVKKGLLSDIEEVCK